MYSDRYNDELPLVSIHNQHRGDYKIIEFNSEKSIQRTSIINKDKNIQLISESKKYIIKLTTTRISNNKFEHEYQGADVYINGEPSSSREAMINNHLKIFHKQPNFRKLDTIAEIDM